jgi:hypothetical protein
MGGQDLSCHLCGKAEESDIHIFFECPVAKKIWFGCSWCLRTDEVHPTNSEDILKFVLDPPPYGQRHEEAFEHCSIKLAITIEAIWNLRNTVAHDNGKVNHRTIINNLELRVQEHIAATCNGESLKPQGPLRSSCPPIGTIKLNVDAAVLKDHTQLAVVARDDQGQVLKAWSKEHILCQPMQAEASAIQWALNLAKDDRFENIILEGDAKICFDALNEISFAANWDPLVIICN